MTSIKRLSAFPILFALLLGVAGCDETLRPEGRSPDDLVGRVVDGDFQTGTVGETLSDSLTVEVLDTRGRPVAGLPLEWRVISEGGGEVHAGSTTTDGKGRARSLWMLGSRAGTQLVEVRAMLRQGPAVLDTVQATAEPGAPSVLRVAGDTIREMVVGDTLRVGLEAQDRYANPIPPAKLGAAWSSSAPGVASVDGEGLVRALERGTAQIEARAGEVRARVHFSVAPRADTFVVNRLQYTTYQFYQNGGRLLALAEVYARSSNGYVAYEFDGSQWMRLGQGVSGTPVVPPHLYVDAQGEAFTSTLGSVHYSRRAGEWGAHPALEYAADITGSGATVLAFSWVKGTYPAVWKLYRVQGEAVEESTIPPPPVDYVRRSAMSGAEIYAGNDTLTTFWNGSAWKSLSWPGATARAARLLAAPAQGGSVYAVAGTNALFSLRAGEPTRVPNPLEERGETIQWIAVDRNGHPYLAYQRGIVWWTESGWKEYTIADGWKMLNGVWPDEDGSVWLAAGRPTGEMGYYGEYLDHIFLRIRDGAK